MPTKTESATVPKIVRWTDDEWTRIASYLSSIKGTVQFASSNLAEVKAKDVFIAQQVLPTDRQRKLVSIAQGFDGIRTRLGVIVQSLPQDSQDDGFQPQHLAHRDEEVKKRKTSNLTGAATGKAGQLAATVHLDEAKVNFHPEPQAAYAGSATATVSPPRLRRAAWLNSGVTEPTVREPTAGQTLESNGTLETREGCSLQTEQLSSDQPNLFQGESTFRALARPFIEMFCEELARAFVGVLSNQKAHHALQIGTLEAASRRAASTQAADDCHSPVLQASRELDDTTQSQSIANNQSRPASQHGVQGDDDMDSDEVEVQPLFDPKLPPSANSDFKPNIGVIATHANDLQELRQLYPQLNLTIVQADSVSDVRCFGHCQRIIALRDEVPPATDELLGRLLRHRYVRLDGGISGIKAQLNAWLHAPGSISSPPKRVMPRYGAEPVGGMVKNKNKQNRYPRMVGR
jgi:hypothetical protein